MFLSSCILLILLMTLGNNVVHGERMIRYMFNDGIAPTPGINECTVDDNRWIDPLFNITANLRTRRQLQDYNTTSIDLSNHEDLYLHHRKLFSAKCKDNCEGFVRGTCRATGCIGFRRRELSSSSSTDDDNDELDTTIDQNHREEFTPCNIQIAGINLALDLLVASTKISAPCKSFLNKSKRKIECYDDVIYGEILSFTFYNMNRFNSRWRPVISVIGTNIPNGYKICSNIAFNAEVVLNPCVNNVNFTMTGPNNLKYTRMDDNHPMLLFNTTVNAATFGGRYLSPGAYSFTARPDNFVHKEKKLDFTVVQC